MKVLIASNNLGKVNIYKAVFDRLGIETTYPKELGISVDVEENGATEVENATLKAKAFFEATGLPTIANDSGLVIDKFSAENQPGVLVRRFGGRELTDEEMEENARKNIRECSGWVAEYAQLYLDHYKELPAIRAKIRELTEKL